MRVTLINAVKVLVLELHFHVQLFKSIAYLKRFRLRKEKSSSIIKKGRQEHSLT